MVLGSSPSGPTNLQMKKIKLTSFEEGNIQSPDGKLALVVGLGIVMLQVPGKRAGTTRKVRIIKPSRLFLDPESAENGVDLRCGIWISNTRFLLNVWECFPNHPLFLEYQVTSNNAVLVGLYRSPIDTKGGCIETMGFDGATQTLHFSDHMSEKTRKVTLAALQANKAAKIARPVFW